MKTLYRELGPTQEGVLVALMSHGFWYRGDWGCKWRWGSQSNTERILESLVKHGFVVKGLEPMGIEATTRIVYRVSDAGRAIAVAVTTRVARAKERRQRQAEVR